MLEQINKENFQQMLSRFNTTELEGMIEKFPYFQQAHLLLAKKYQQENNPKFDQQLQLAALYIQDRELLYSLFNDKSVVAKPVVTPATETPVVVEKEPMGEAVVEIVAEVEKIVIPVKQAEPEVEDKDLNVLLEQIEKSAKELNTYAQTPRQEKIETNTEEAHPETKPVVELALPASETVLELPEVGEDEEIILEKEEEKQPEVAIPLPPVMETEDDVDHEETSLVEEKPMEVFSRIEPHTFDEWLKAFNNKSTQPKETPVVAEKKVPEENDELEKLLAVNVSVDYLHGLVKEETTYAKGLERFIEEQIQKHKQPEVKKVPEYDPSTEPATETMAKVFEMQKKYAKAIKTYEALVVKFPARSSYFVAQINYLKKLI